MRFVDSHLHVDRHDPLNVAEFATSAAILLFACGVDEKTSLETLKLPAVYPGAVRSFVGVHPSEAEKAGDLAWFERASRRASGIGEIGLDPSYSPTGPGSAQRRVFETQVEAAARSRLPVQVHSRQAESECLEVLGTFHLGRVLMHWLENGSALPKAADRGYFVSVSPALVYSKKLQRLARELDPSYTLLESDYPVQYAPFGSARGPVLVPSVAFKLAELWGKPFAEVISTTSENALRFLGPWKG